jgi:aldehyde:ferredoxin oxidoreductase
MGHHGYNGKILHVDLSSREIIQEQPTEVFYRKYLGGSALALYYLLKKVQPGTDPLSPANVLVFSASVVTGTPAMGFSRYTVAAKSPLTCGFGEAEAGGWWGPELKFAGFDAIVVSGKADKPVYLWIHDGQAELKNASHIWGQFAKASLEMIKKELGDEKVRIALIGPGGENLVKYACILNKIKHANGRSGLGAVMGSKNLKAIAVRGHAKIPLNNETEAKAIARGFVNAFKKMPDYLGEMGTAGFVEAANAAGILPTRNFRSGEFENAEEISGSRMKATLEVGRGSCYACPVRCKRKVKVEEPFEVDPDYGGPEHETVAAFGSLCGVGDIKAFARANQLCQAYTLDTISTGATIAFAMECFEKGIISLQDTDGLELSFGNAESMLALIEKIGLRVGFGDILAEGIIAAADKFGAESLPYAMHVKGQPLPLHEPRGKVGVALAYATSPTGADHQEAPHDPIFEAAGGLGPFGPLGILEPVAAMDFTGRKVRLFGYLQQLYNLFNSIGVCNFTATPWGPVSINGLVDYVRAVTGWNTSLWELMKVGERQGTMARVFNLRQGLTSRHDRLPDRFFEPLEGASWQGIELMPVNLSAP